MANRAVDLIREIVELTYDPERKDTYWAQLAYKQGELDSLKYQLAESESAIQELTALALQAPEVSNNQVI